MNKSLSDQLQQTFAGSLDHLTREAEHMVIHALACTLHNNGYALEGNTAETDEGWFAAQLWATRYGESSSKFECLAEDERTQWLTIAHAAIAALPRLMARIAHRCVLHSQALRTIERGYRLQEKKKC
jgi:hypothetical protein